MNAEPVLTYDIASPFARPPYGAREADKLCRQVLSVYRSAPKPRPVARAPEPPRPLRPATSRTGVFVVRPLSKRGGVSRTGRAVFADSRRDAFAFAILAAREGRSVAILGRGYTETVLATVSPTGASSARIVRTDGAVAYVSAAADVALAAAALAFDGTTFQRG